MTQNYAKSALESSESGDFAEAGDYYTQAAYQALAHNVITAGNGHQVGGGLDRLLRAALCYQRASLPSRARNRSEQGVLITRDLQQNVITDEKRSAVLQKFIADFHGIGNLEGADQAYQLPSRNSRLQTLSTLSAFTLFPSRIRLSGLHDISFSLQNAIQTSNSSTISPGESHSNATKWRQLCGRHRTRASKFPQKLRRSSSIDAAASRFGKPKRVFQRASCPRA